MKAAGTCSLHRADVGDHRVIDDDRRNSDGLVPPGMAAMLEAADTTMYEAKRDGGDRFAASELSHWGRAVAIATSDMS
jgi:hypothetical protein